MNRYRPFEKERRSKRTPIIWACGLGLFSLSLFIGLILVEEHLVFTPKGLFFDFEEQDSAQKVEPDFVLVPDLVVESQTELVTEEETEPESEEDPDYYPTSFAEGSIYAASFGLDVTVEELREYPVNTVILTLRDRTGIVAYQSSVEAVCAHSTENPIDLKNKLAELHDAGYQVFARISVFADDAFAEDHPESALKSISKTAWTDQKGNRWANPYSQVFNDYFEELLKEYASFEFDGYLFENAAFPYDAKDSECLYMDDSTEEREKEVEDTVEAIHMFIRNKPVWMLTDVPSLMSEGTNPSTGINTDVLNKKGIGIALMITVSSSGNLAYELKEEGYCTTLNYEDVLNAYPEIMEGSPAPLPVIVQKGGVNGDFAETFTEAYRELRKLSPGRTALMLEDTESYTPEMLALSEEDQAYLVRSVHEKAPEPVNEPTTGETSTEEASSEEEDTETGSATDDETGQETEKDRNEEQNS